MQTTETISNRLKILASGRFHCSVEALRPDIKMMIDWMSAELGDLYRSLRQSGDVMERRIRQYLQPDTLNRPFPAHTLAYAQPRKNGYMLNPEDDVWQLQTPGNGSNPVFFTPLAPLPLVRGKVRYLACGNILSDRKSVV